MTYYQITALSVIALLFVAFILVQVLLYKKMRKIIINHKEITDDERKQLLKDLKHSFSFSVKRILIMTLGFAVLYLALSGIFYLIATRL